MIEQVLIYHNPCGLLVEAERDSDTRTVYLTGELHDHPQCGYAWAQGYDVVGPVTVHYLTEQAPEVDATPQALILAHDLDLDPATITASGPGGQLTKLDVENAYLDRLNAALEAFDSAAQQEGNPND